MKAVILMILLFISFSVQAQKIFSQNDLVAVVKKFHPVAKMASLDVRISKANITASRGAFDPVANVHNSRKKFDGINYYNQQWGELKIPAWYGVDFYAGTEKLTGDRINPEETKGTINYVGVSVPLVQNLIIDKRRAAVKRAKILMEQSEAERQVALNDLVAEALEAYYDWWKNYQQLQVVKASLQNAKARFDMVGTMYRLGERPAIDTLEAATQVQYIEQQETEALMFLQKSKLQLSLYLWGEENMAYDLPEDAVPETTLTEEPLLIDSLLAAAGLHPRLLQYDFQLNSLRIEKRLKFQRLFPELTVKYNSISRDFSEAFNDVFLDNNYRFGLTLSMPLRLSEERGEYQAAKLKLEQAKVAQIAEQVTIQNKVEQYYIEWVQTTSQYQQQQNLVLNYKALLRGEEIKFTNGESSLFLINSREAKNIEGQMKELSLAAKMQKAGMRLRWAAGLFGNF